MRVAYIRVSTLDQNPDRQLRIDIEKNYMDKCSGSISFVDRPEAKKLLSNTNVTEIVVHSIDRLGRDTIDIMQTIQYFTNLGVNVISEKEGFATIVNGKENPVSKMLIGILGTLAEFELSRSKERQAEGIAKAKERGAYDGRPTGTVEDIETFISKKSTQSILKYLRQGESINRTAKLSETSTGTVKKVKIKIKEGLITL